MDVGRASVLGARRGRPVSRRRSKRQFSRTASGTRKENVRVVMRGGTRL